MTIEERMARPERELAGARRTSRLLVVLLAGAMLWTWVFASGTLTAQDRVQDEVRARQFILDDGNGITRAALSMQRNEPVLALYDENNHGNLQLLLHNGVPAMNLYDAQGMRRAVLEVDEEGPYLGMSDGVLKSGMPVLGLSGVHSAPRTMLAVEKEGPVLLMTDRDGTTRTLLSSAPESPALVLFDKSGGMTWSAP